jgi:Fic family protein
LTIKQKPEIINHPNAELHEGAAARDVCVGCNHYSCIPIKNNLFTCKITIFPVHSNNYFSYRMSINTFFTQKRTVFHGQMAPEEGTIAGYAAIIDVLKLETPLPNRLMLISQKNKKYEQEGWTVFPVRYQPENSLYKQLVFALKYEGVNLLALKKAFEKLRVTEIVNLLQIEPTGQYSRKIWFLYEWLLQKQVPIADIQVKSYVQLVDNKLQFALNEGKKSSRHRILNNLPGTTGFCPLIFKTKKLVEYINSDLAVKKSDYLKSIHKDVLQRTSAFLLLKDSKASFTIEGETPANNRAVRWGKAIGQAGDKSLSKEELTRLQQIIIENSRFTEMGMRKKGGFVGEYDRTTSEPIPDHISAKWQNLDALMDALLATSELLERDPFDPVLAAAIIAFGFVFIHPFEDGNGRIHRYLIHHILARKKMTDQGVIFPVSASILNKIDDYRKTLETYSHPLLDYIEWKGTSDHNVEVTNNTIDYYRYYDATSQAEFLYECVKDTIENEIPREVNYLQCYDQFKRYIDNTFEMPDKMVALLVRFLEQNNGKISSRAKKKEFVRLDQNEIEDIERNYKEIFIED